MADAVAICFVMPFFGDLPNGVAAAGIVVTLAAGLYVIHREHRRARLAAPPAP